MVIDDVFVLAETVVGNEDVSLNPISTKDGSTVAGAATSECCLFKR